MDPSKRSSPLSRLREAAAQLAEQAPPPEPARPAPPPPLPAERPPPPATSQPPASWGGPAAPPPAPQPAGAGDEGIAVHPSFRKLAAKLQPDVPAPIFCVGIFHKKGAFARGVAGSAVPGVLGGLAGAVVTSRLDVRDAKRDRLPPDLALAFAGDRIYVFGLDMRFAAKPTGLFEKWERAAVVRGSATKRSVTVAVTLDFASGRHLELEAKKGLDNPNGDAVRLLTGD